MKNFLKNALIVLTILTITGGQAFAADEKKLGNEGREPITPPLPPNVELPHPTPERQIKLPPKDDIKFPWCWWWCEPPVSRLDPRIFERVQPGELRQPINPQQPRPTN